MGKEFIVRNLVVVQIGCDEYTALVTKLDSMLLLVMLLMLFIS